MKFVSPVLLVAGTIAVVLLWPAKPAPAPIAVRSSAEAASIAAAAASSPVLTQVPPAPAAEIVTPGPQRAAWLRQRAAQWATADIRGALAWLKSLNAADQAIAVEGALAQIGRSDPAGAIALAVAFDVGVNDGRAEHFAQLWTEENPTDAVAWVTAQPANATRDRLLARSARVRAARDAAEAIRMVGLISAGPIRDAALTDVMQQWKLYDPAGANDAIARFPTLAAEISQP